MDLSNPNPQAVGGGMGSDTLRQIEVAQQECYCPVEVALLPDTRHAPYREAPEATLRAIADFANRLLRDHHEGDIATRIESGPARVRSL